MGYNVAVDGPAGAGKSTIAKLVAKEKGYIYVDTGAMYRGLAIHFLKKGISPEDKEAVAKACIDADVSIVYENGVQQVYLNGENITGMLRTEEVGNMASKTSAIPAVREKLLELQKTLDEKIVNYEKHFGIGNVNKRISNPYFGNGRISVESCLYEGTSITIEFDQMEKYDEECNDCR